MKYTDKERAVLSIFERWKGCTKCELGQQREAKRLDTRGEFGNIVFGDGIVNADMVVIGIGPGEQEDKDGVPFVGESGQILNEYLEVVSMRREELFVMNIVACRPFSKSIDFKTKRPKEENRDPTPLERECCRPLWQEVLYTIDPLVVVAMGKPAIMEVTGKRSVSMREAQGAVTSCQIPGKAVMTNYTVIPMYHPAFLSRSGDTFKGGPWHQALVAWKRAVYFLDQLRNLYRGTPMPDRGIKEEDLFLVQGGI
jgi:uracil-DNA glycosylase family 4